MPSAIYLLSHTRSITFSVVACYKLNYTQTGCMRKERNQRDCCLCLVVVIRGFCGRIKFRRKRDRRTRTPTRHIVDSSVQWEERERKGEKETRFAHDENPKLMRGFLLVCRACCPGPRMEQYWFVAGRDIKHIRNRRVEKYASRETMTTMSGRRMCWYISRNEKNLQFS